MNYQTAPTSKISWITHERTLNVSTDAKKEKLMKAFENLSAQPETETIKQFIT